MVFFARHQELKNHPGRSVLTKENQTKRNYASNSLEKALFHTKKISSKFVWSSKWCFFWIKSWWPWIFESKQVDLPVFYDDLNPSPPPISPLAPGGWAPGKDFRWKIFFRRGEKTRCTKNTQGQLVNIPNHMSITLASLVGLKIRKRAGFFLCGNPWRLGFVLDEKLQIFSSRWPGCGGHQLERFYSKIPTHIERCPTGALFLGPCCCHWERERGEGWRYHVTHPECGCETIILHHLPWQFWYATRV